MYRDLIFLAISLFTWGIGESMWFIFQPLYLQQMGASPMLIGSLIGSMGIMYAVSQIPAGMLSDRFGNRIMLLAAWGIAILATIIMAFSQSLPLFILGMLIYGLTAFVTTPLNAYTASMRGNLSVPRALTLISASFQLGAVIGPYFGGFLAEQYGLQIIYRISILFFIPSTVALYFIQRDVPSTTHAEKPRGGIVRNKVLLAFTALSFLTSFATYLPQPLTPNFLQNQRQLSLETIGLLGSMGSLGNATLALVLGGFSAVPGFLIGQGLVAFFSVIMWNATGSWLYLGYFLLGGYRLMRLMGMAFTRSLVDQAHTGKAFGLLETANATATILAPTLAGILYSTDPTLIYLVSLTAICIALIANGVYFTIYGRLKKQNSCED